MHFLQQSVCINRRLCFVSVFSMCGVHASTRMTYYSSRSRNSTSCFSLSVFVYPTDYYQHSIFKCTMYFIFIFIWVCVCALLMMLRFFVFRFHHFSSEWFLWMCYLYLLIHRCWQRERKRKAENWNPKTKHRALYCPSISCNGYTHTCCEHDSTGYVLW